MTGLRLRQHVDGAERDLPVSAVIVAIGHGPRSELLGGIVDLDPTGMSSLEKGPAAPRSTAYSPPATWLTAATGRPSPRRQRLRILLDAERWLAKSALTQCR